MANKDKLLESAQKFLAKGQLPKAIGEYQKLVEAFPKDYRNRQKLAELLSRERRNDEAQPHYEAVAKNFTETGFYLKAIAIYKQMQKIEPSRVDIYLRLAELNEKQGLIGNALNEYRSLITFYDKNRMARETVGVLQKMIALDPDNLGFRGKLIETLDAIGETDDALEHFRTLVRLLDGKGEHAKIVKLYEKFIELSPDDVENRLPLAVALLATDAVEKALALLKGLLKQSPEHPLLLAALTDCHLAAGNHADARLTCQHLLKEQPQDLDLRERYARICLGGADYERALEFLEESKEAFSAVGRVAVLRELYEELRPALPGNVRLQATLAAIYEATGVAGNPVAGSAPAIAAVEETADAAVIDAAIDDVEQLDLVGDPVPPVATVPPLGAPAVAAKPAKPAGGLELELDLDLDLDLEAETPAAPQPPAGPVAVTPPAAEPPPPAPAPSVVDAAPLEMELELDLGGLDDFAAEPPADAEPADAQFPAAIMDGAGPAAEVPAVAESPAEEVALPIPEPDVLEDVAVPDFVVEPPAAAAADDELAGAGPPAEEAGAPELPDLEGLLSALPETTDLFAEEPAADEPQEAAVVVPVEPDDAVVASAAECEAASEMDDAAECADVEEIEEIEEAEPIEEAEEAEEAEALEEIEEVEELEEWAAHEDGGASPEAEAFEVDEELEEAEPIEELEEYGEFDAVAGGPESAAVVTPVSPQQLRDGLEEAEFYLRQGLFDDAARVVHDLRQRHGDLAELAEALAGIEAQRQAAAEAGEGAAPFDLLADIRDGELLGVADFLDTAAGDAVDDFSLAETAENAEDAQSHFDLGIAYKEMGLLDDAIAEFGKALRDPSRQLDCLTLKGQCQIEMGEIAKAEATFKEGLALPHLTEEGMVALRYELGLLYESADRPLEALESFQFVADRELFYRDVTDKLKLLRQKLGIDDQAIEAVSEGGGRDRISFI